MKTEFVYSHDVEVKPLKDGLYCLSQVFMKQEGSVMMKESCHKADLEQCMCYNDVCKVATESFGKGLVRYVSANNNMIVLCRHHALEVNLTRRYHILSDGTVLVAQGGNTHP